ncbi:hypothetical protein JCM11641_003474 [Rhodosporidiobolus odoratus]
MAPDKLNHYLVPRQLFHCLDLHLEHCHPPDLKPQFQQWSAPFRQAYDAMWAEVSAAQRKESVSTFLQLCQQVEDGRIKTLEDLHFLDLPSVQSIVFLYKGFVDWSLDAIQQHLAHAKEHDWCQAWVNTARSFFSAMWTSWDLHSKKRHDIVRELYDVYVKVVLDKGENRPALVRLLQFVILGRIGPPAH